MLWAGASRMTPWQRRKERQLKVNITQQLTGLRVDCCVGFKLSHSISTARPVIIYIFPADEIITTWPNRPIICIVLIRESLSLATAGRLNRGRIKRLVALLLSIQKGWQDGLRVCLISNGRSSGKGTETPLVF